MGKTSIQWTDETWNPVRGCDKVSAGCKNCYASTFAERWRGVKGHPYEQGFDLRLVPNKLTEPLHWKEPRRVFVNSMSDLFHEDVPDEFIWQVFAIMANARQHTFQILTKRARRMADLLTDKFGPFCQNVKGTAFRFYQDDVLKAGADFFRWPLPNVWLGVSVEDQERADERIPHLLRTPAAVRFLSCEPLLEPVDLRASLRILEARYTDVPSRDFGLPVRDIPVAHEVPALSWVIVGGESGPGARPMDIGWARSLVQQCKDYGVPVFCKQWGSRPLDAGVPVKLRDRKGGDPAEWDGDWPREFPNAA